MNKEYLPDLGQLFQNDVFRVENVFRVILNHPEIFDRIDRMNRILRRIIPSILSKKSGRG